MGIGGEAGAPIDDQIGATLALGWKYIEMREVRVGDSPKANIHDLSEADFDVVVAKLQEAGIKVYCFASAIMNWQKTIKTPFVQTEAEVRRAISRMQKLGVKFVRIMSLKPGDDEFATPIIASAHVREVTKRFLDAGIQPVHENCMNYGGMSWCHTLNLLEQCPGLKLVFDTGNPVFNPDRRGSQPWRRQDAWEFWTHVREHVVHIHIKDAIWRPVEKKEIYTWPGEGAGYVRSILTDALQNGYNGGISIEPHMVEVFHGPQTEAPAAGAARKNFVQYGRKLEQIIEEITEGV